MLIAFHGSQDIKDKYIVRVRSHRAADELVQGTGWENGKGCAVGCTLESYEHDRYPIELGIPLHLAYLEDRLFELQTPEDAQRWPERFLSAIRPGADLSKVWSQWAVWMLVDPDHGVIRHAKTDATRAAIDRVAQLWRDGGTADEFRAARRAAADAADAADADAAADAAADADAYAADAAAYAADAAADSADAAAAYAADADAAAAADDAAWRNARSKWAAVACDKLVALLEAA
jgi:hypothetical protein